MMFIITRLVTAEVRRSAASHRRALSEPDVRLSPHPAPIAQLHPWRGLQWANRRGCRRATRSSQWRERRQRRRRDFNGPSTRMRSMRPA